MAGFVFVLVDTDQYMPQLDPFTLDSLFGAYNVMRSYTYGFTLYFLILTPFYLRTAQFLWWKPAAIGIGIYAVFATARLFWDGMLFQPFESLEIRNFIMLGVVVALVSNPSSWRGWLKPYLTGSVVALIVRIFAHFVLGRKDTADFLGVETMSFYEGFNIQCEVAVAIGVALIVWLMEHRKWLRAIVVLALVLACLGVIGSGFRRMPIFAALSIPCFGLCIAYWIRRQLLRGIAILVPTVAFVIIVTACVVLGNYGMDASAERLSSIISLQDANVAQSSNLIYLDDFDAMCEIMQTHPCGVGYGNSFGVYRLIDTVFDTNPPPFEDDLALHVGSYEVIARMGPFGFILILALIWTPLRALGRMKGMVPPIGAMIAGACSAFFLFRFLAPFCPPMTIYLKVMATFGLALGAVLQAGFRSVPSTAPKTFIAQIH